MKAAQVDKLYNKLTPTEQAALAFEAIARNDDAELNVIVESVERKDYRCTHWDFRWRLSGLTNLASYYAMIYWKTRTYMEVVNSKYNECGNEADQKAAFVFLDRLLAMEVALADVCAKMNIDVLAVKKFAQCDNEHTPEKCNDEELVKAYVGLFMRMIG
ncbi:hypothetical protein [Methyloglobulus sp.]|uniref:hypothetical protein n=1 Tax=Methyloglobulus sp. TaxID=2518622 RepID=UPI003988EE72